MERMDEVILTIAIPVYNVEKYLKRCLNSLVNQKYLSKEILIINDGSKDGSLEIIKEYANKYECVRYIDQENAGLAAVRNRCIREAKGKYISFIDSDDYVLDGLYEHLIPFIEKNEIDIMCYGVENLYENTSDTSNLYNLNNKEEIISYFSTEEALDEFLLPNNIDVITCNKIIRRDLYNGIEYPTGKLYEDMFTNYKLVAKANKICSTNYIYYVYCHRESSIGGMKYNSKTMDLYRAVTEVYEYSNKNGLTKPKHLNVGYITWLVVVLNIMIRSEHRDKIYRKRVQQKLRKHIKEINSDEYLNRTRKIQYNILAISFYVYKIIYLGYLKKNRS